MIGTLAAKDFRRKIRAPIHLALVLAFPLALLSVIGLAFRSAGSTTGLPAIRLLVENRDDEFVGSLLGSGLRNEKLRETFDVEIVDTGAGEEIVAAGDAAALLVIPAGFTDSLFGGGPAALTLVKDPGGVILPEIAEGLADLLALVLSTGARIFHEPLAEIREMMHADDAAPEERIAEVALLVHRSIRGAGRLFLPPAIGVEKAVAGEGGEEENEGRNVFAFLFPGIAVLGLLFVGQISMRDLIRERQGGHLNRLLASPARMGEIIASKLVSTVLLLLLCHLLLAAVAGPIFHIRWGNLPASFLLVAAEGIAITGFLALLFSVARTERQAEALSSIVILSMSLLGGSMAPVELFPDALQTIGRATLNYWAIDGFREVMLRGGSTGTILSHLAVLAGFGSAAAVAGALLLPRSLRKGA